MKLEVVLDIWRRRVIDSGQANKIGIEGAGREYKKYLNITSKLPVVSVLK
jgi:hypothetical protein